MWVVKDPKSQADSKDADQTTRVRRLSCLRWAHVQYCSKFSAPAQVFERILIIHHARGVARNFMKMKPADRISERLPVRLAVV